MAVSVATVRVPTVSHPINVQHSWLRDEVISALDSCAVYTNNIIKRRVISKTRKVSPLVSIFKRMKILPNRIVTVVLSDSTHRMFAVFPFEPTIVAFENRYCQPFTHHMQQCLIRVVQADLIFLSPSQVYEMFDVRTGLALAVMKVLDFEIFQRDQVSFDVAVQKNLQDLYRDPHYVELCRPRPPAQRARALDQEREEENEEEEFDDVVSI